MRWLFLAVIALWPSAGLLGQDSLEVVRSRAVSAMYSRMEFDRGGTITQLYIRSTAIRPNKSNFEWSAGLLHSHGLGGLGGEAGAALALGSREATLLLRGGVGVLMAGGVAFASSMAVGAYGGMSFVVGDINNTSLRVDLSRHAYQWYREPLSAWGLGVGLTWRPAPRKQTGRCH